MESQEYEEYLRKRNETMWERYIRLSSFVSYLHHKGRTDLHELDRFGLIDENTPIPSKITD